ATSPVLQSWTEHRWSSQAGEGAGRPPIGTAITGRLLAGHDGIAQHADALQLDLDHITPADPRRLAGRAGEDQVAGVQRDVAADEAHGRGDVMDEPARPLLLLLLAVNPRAQHEIVVIQARGDIRTDRAERIGALRAPPLHVLALRVILPVALADI